ncbi:MAG: hypothetical protein HPY78_07055 [Brevinematales bacterium]|nr:hypothetical protein [Brevinematales bacterium]
MIERMQALSVMGRLDTMLYEIMQTRHEISSSLQQVSQAQMEEGKGLLVDIVV